jgi:predicted metal-dependent phosphoesterase TrpH
MENKTLAQIFLEQDQREDELMIDTLNKKYMNTIIKPYRESDKLIDLHTHTNYSDGDLSPDELIRLAIQKRIGTIAITDHDTLEGIKKVDRTSSFIIDSGINVINGIELSARIEKGRMHILGLGINIYNEKLNNRLNQLKNINLYSIMAIILQLKKDYDILFTYDEIKELINQTHNLGRPDIAKLCVKNGHAISVSDAFDKYLIEAYNKTAIHRKGLPYPECIDLILGSNGIPVLAHPKSLELPDKELLYLIKDMVKCGLKGIEVYHPTHTKEETRKYLEIANELNLLISGGSDFHGMTVKPNVELGTGINNNIKIKKLSILEKK